MTTTEAIATLTKMLGVDVEIVDRQSEDDDWIINTQKSPVYPTTLRAGDDIEVVMSDGLTVTSYACAWDQSWSINDKFRHIVKYRKV